MAWGAPPATGARIWNSMWGPSGVWDPPTVPTTCPACTSRPSIDPDLLQVEVEGVESAAVAQHHGGPVAFEGPGEDHRSRLYGPHRGARGSLGCRSRSIGERCRWACALGRTGR